MSSPEFHDNTITEFLLARIAEDEAAARAHLNPGEGVIIDKRRVLAECEAKRRLVEMHESRVHPVVSYERGKGGEPEPLCDVCPECSGNAYWDDIYAYLTPFPCPTLRALASVYADHPDYRPEWL